MKHQLITLAAALLVCTHPAKAEAAPPTQKPNVILILADDLGYGELGAYGGPVKTPHMDRLAVEGVRCTDGYAGFPVCSPSRAALLTGRYPQRFGPTYEDYFGHGALELDPVEHVTIGQLMKEAGYRTACFGKWNVSNAKRTPANAFGFDTWVGLHLNHDFYTHKLVANGEHDLFKDGEPFDREGVWSDTIFADEAIRFIQEKSDPSTGVGQAKPFFIYLPFQAPHDPIQDPDTPNAGRLDPTDPANRPILVKMIERLDTEIGRVLAALDEEDLADNTLVILTSDNGGTKSMGRNLPLRGAKQQLLEGGIRVPLILRWPQVLPAGKTFHQPVTAMDLTATIAASGGAQARPGKAFDGVDLLSVLNGEAELPAARPLFFRRRHIVAWKGINAIQQSAVRQGDWKLLRSYRPIGSDRFHSALYHLKDDVGETRNLYARHPGKAKHLETLLEAWEAETAKTAIPFKFKHPGDKATAPFVPR